ncbi:hypothetical protein X771_00385 [Mesorhizobium sp. LSJC277A00]|nr:hypothetical protein X771_00385 [Mesorhizobium sp. LSJC277A00]
MINSLSFSTRHTMTPGWTRGPKDQPQDILSHDFDGQLQFNRVGREVNTSAVNKFPNDHPGLVGREPATFSVRRNRQARPCWGEAF